MTHKNSFGAGVADDTARARKGTAPPILTDVYGAGAGASSVPAAARFGVGARTLDEIGQATQARRDQRPGDHYRSTNKAPQRNAVDE